MATLAHTTTDYTNTSATNWLIAYKSYVNKAEYNRIDWAATALAIQGCVLSPTVLLLMAYCKGGD